MLKEDATDWISEFQIQSFVDLDFVIGQSHGLPIGMTRRSPAEFRRRVLAASVSYFMQLRSIDYALKRYVEPDQYENPPTSLGDQISDFIKTALVDLQDELGNLHTKGGERSFGWIGAEIAFFKLPATLDTARMLANRGLLLEVLPILRLCFEMIAWRWPPSRWRTKTTCWR